MASDAGTFGGGASLITEALRFPSSKSARGKASVGYELEKVPYAEFRRRFVWRQGEHVTLLGTTGSGKTTLAVDIQGLRDYVIGFGAKSKDSTLDRLVRMGYERYYDWPVHANVHRALMWPDISKVNDPEMIAPLQRKIFARTIAGIYQQGGWCAFFDELQYITDELNLERAVKVLYQQGRSLGISVLAGTQRPRFIPLVAYDQATHIFFWRENDEENLRRVAGIGYANKDLIMSVVSSLEHVPEKGGDFLYLNTRTGEMMVSKVDLNYRR